MTNQLTKLVIVALFYLAIAVAAAESFANILIHDTQPTITPPHPEKEDRHYNPPKFDECKRLQEIIHGIKAHILSSESTRAVYVLICRIFARQLVDGHRAVEKPSDSAILKIISSSWPTFIPVEEHLMSNPSTVVWGHVDKFYWLPEVELNPDLVSALESAPKDSRFYNTLVTILTVTILHELSHHITKVLFQCPSLPSRCGPDRGGLIGKEFGELLIGGNVSVLWKDGKAGEMDKIEALLLDYQGSLRKLTYYECWAFLTSVQDSPDIRGFPFHRLKVYTKQPGYTHFPILDPSSEQAKQVNIPPPRMLPCR